MRLTYKYRLRPTKAQKHQLENMLELCRSVYNATLATRKYAYERRGESLNYYDTAALLPLWKSLATDLKQVHSQVLQNVQLRVDLAFKAFFRRVKAGEAPGYPRFKGRGQYQSLTYPQCGNGVKLTGNALMISKVGAIQVHLHRPLKGKIKTVTLQRNTVGKWDVCFACEVQFDPLPVNTNSVGIDLGLKTFAFLSDRSRIDRQRWMKRDADTLARLQRKKEKLPLGSLDRAKTVHALQHAYQRSTQRRTNFAHQMSRKLVNTYQFMAFEKLDIQQMQGVGNTVINRGIADVAWGQFVRYTLYKAENAGRTVVLVNPRGTTQECSSCGEIVLKDLSRRVHDCPHCGLKIDRDLNAALNILGRGLASVGAASSVTRRSPSFKCGE
ncbi:MAG: transposase [Chloroflexota bacterium]